MTEQNSTSTEVWGLKVATLPPDSYYLHPCIYINKTMHCTLTFLPLKHMAKQCPSRCTQFRLECNEKITSWWKHTEWQPWHKHSTRRNDNTSKPLAFQMYLTFVPQHSWKNLCLFTWIHHNICVVALPGIIHYKSYNLRIISWNWIIYFRFTEIKPQLPSAMSTKKG
jgi:hypothetical protein